MRTSQESLMQVERDDTLSCEDFYFGRDEISLSSLTLLEYALYHFKRSEFIHALLDRHAQVRNDTFKDSWEVRIWSSGEHA